MKTREHICAELNTLLFKNPEIIAVWEGGSAATGFLDEYSDLDLAIVCKDESVEIVFTELQDFLEKSYGIIKQFRMPEPTWHGFSQCFYQIDKVPELFYLDIGVLKKSLPDKFTESDRHGNSVIWFEKEKIIDSTPSSQEKIIIKSKQFYKMATQTDFLTILEVKKALARGNFSEAFPVYYQFIARNLGILLNLKHRPCKVDFGLRYAYRDYTPEDAALIESSFKIQSIDEMKDKFQIAYKRFIELKIEFAES